MCALPIVPASAENAAALLPLIADYQRFYGVTPDAERNASFFGALRENSSRGLQLVALLDGEAVGFATLYFTLSSLGAKPGCTLNDLFVAEPHRRGGIARALITAASAEAHARGFARFDWMTASTNASARKLYDSLGATLGEWCVYVLDTAPVPQA